MDTQVEHFHSTQNNCQYSTSQSSTSQSSTSQSSTSQSSTSQSSTSQSSTSQSSQHRLGGLPSIPRAVWSVRNAHHAVTPPFLEQYNEVEIPNKGLYQENLSSVSPILSGETVLFQRFNKYLIGALRPTNCHIRLPTVVTVDMWPFCGGSSCTNVYCIGNTEDLRSKEHFGMALFVLYKEVALFVRFTIYITHREDTF